MDEGRFEAKLKHLKRQKEQVEEELEASAERWRTEKRRLHTEIERLESALAEARAKAAKREAADKSPATDPAVIARIQEAAEEKIKKTTQEWEAERTRLKTKISRLESAVAEAIERSSNPIRATQSVKERFEAELDRVAKEKVDIEQAFLRAKTEWEQEKLKMAGEVIKLRRAAKIMGQPIPREDAPEANPKVRALENQLQESLTRWNAERERLSVEVQRLEHAARQWDTERRQLNDHAGQLQRAFVQAQAKIEAYENTISEDNQSQRKSEELRRQRDALDLQLQESRNTWDAERQRLNAEIERKEQQLQRVSKQSEGVSSQVVDQLRRQYEQRLQEAIQQKTQLAQELQSASALLESERARLSSQISGSENGNEQNNGNGTLDKETIAAEVTRVEEKIHQIATLIDDPEVELSTVIRKNVEKAELDAYLKGILFSLGRGKGL